MQISRRGYVASLLLALGGGATARHVAAEDGSREVPLVYAAGRSSLPDPSSTPAVGVTPGGVFVASEADSWEGPIGDDADDGGTDPKPVETFGSLNGIEVVDPADGYEALQGVLDEYGHDPVSILLTEGTLTVETNVTVPSNTWLRGVGQGTVVTLADGVTLDVSGVIRVPADTNNIVFSDFVIDGNRANVTNEGHEYGFFTKDASNIVCERLTVRNCPGYGFDPHAGSMWETTTDIRLSNCVAVGNGKDGITFAGIEHGVIDSCVARNNDRYGVNVTDPDCREVTVTNTISAENGDAGVVLQNDPRFVTVANNRVHNNGGDGIRVSTIDGSASHCSIIGNAVRRNGRYGVAVLQAHHVAIVGNNLRENARENGKAECMLGEGDGWAAHDCLVFGNTIETSAEYGIEERPSGGRPNVIVANVANGASTTDVKRRNRDSRVAFNVGTSYRTTGTVTVPAAQPRALIADVPPNDHRLSDLRVTPLDPLGNATTYWVSESGDAYKVVLDRAPGQPVAFAFDLDSRG